MIRNKTVLMLAVLIVIGLVSAPVHAGFLEDVWDTLTSPFKMEVTQCKNIYCNDYEFICCGVAKDGNPISWNFVYSWGNLQNPYTCESMKCKVSYSPLSSSYPKPYLYVGSQNCRNDWSGYYCSNERTIMPNDYIYQGDILYSKLSFSNVRIQKYKRALKWCGDSGCGSDVDGNILGIDVFGATECAFVTNNDIYDSNGKLVRDAQQGKDFQVTVPEGNCYLSAKTRHVCGDTCEYCDIDDDCKIGHTYVYNGKGAECQTGQLQLYGCRKYGTEPTDTNVLPWEKGEYYTYGRRCEVIQMIPVQCCPYSGSCGTNAVCDPTTFTCKETAQCRYDWECGQQQGCDREKKEIFGWKCESGKCVKKTTASVECCVNQDCPYNYYCDTDYKCKESVKPKQECPYECCKEDPRFYDKSCPTDKTVCCANGVCAVSEEACFGQPPKDTCEAKVLEGKVLGKVDPTTWPGLIGCWLQTHLALIILAIASTIILGIGIASKGLAIGGLFLLIILAILFFAIIFFGWWIGIIAIVLGVLMLIL